MAVFAAGKKALIMKLSSKVSGPLVNELAIVLGDARTQKILAVDDARYRAFRAARGCLSIEQLDQITAQTGRAWERWMVDAGGRGVKTAQGRAFVAEAHAMWDKTLGPDTKPAVGELPRLRSSNGTHRSSAKTAITRTRHAV
jgi:hypothetical protein